MKRIRRHVKYQGISFEIPFIAEIKKHIMFNPRYRSIADFAREAIREKLRRDQSEAIEVFNKIYKKVSDEELVKEMKNDKDLDKDLNDLSPEELKEAIVFNRKLKEKEIKEIQQEKKEPVIQLSKSELTDMIQSIVTGILDKKQKK